jgi:hypothetical protein
MSRRTTTPLLKCVFCDRSDRLENFVYDTRSDDIVYIVRCRACGAQGPSAGDSETARLLWNDLRGGDRR